jgi:hypothetical protein
MGPRSLLRALRAARRPRFSTRSAVALLAAAVVGSACSTALARPADEPIANERATAAPAQLRHLDAARTERLVAQPVASLRITERAPGAFAWSDAAIVAAATLGLILLSAGVACVALFRRTGGRGQTDAVA